MTIYAVTSGSYSDYGIEQVFLTREKAVAFIKTRETEDEWENFQIEEYETYDEHIEIADGYLDDTWIKVDVDYYSETGLWCIGIFRQEVVHNYVGSLVREYKKRWDDEGKACDILKAEVKLTVKPQLTDEQIIKIAQDEYAKWKAEKEEQQ